MISRMQIDFKKYNADGIGSLPPPFPRVASCCRQPWADKSTTPMVLVHVHRFPNKQNHPCAIHPNETNCPHTIHPNETNCPHTIHPNEINHSRRNLPKRNRRGGACVPARMFEQWRFHTGNGFCASRIVCGELNDGCALAGRRGRAHRHRPYPSPPNHAVCPYRITLYIR